MLFTHLVEARTLRLIGQIIGDPDARRSRAGIEIIRKTVGRKSTAVIFLRRKINFTVLKDTLYGAVFDLNIQNIITEGVPYAVIMIFECFDECLISLICV